MSEGEGEGGVGGGEGRGGEEGGGGWSEERRIDLCLFLVAYRMDGWMDGFGFWQ